MDSETRVRRAGAADADAFVELRAAMFTAMGVDGVDGQAWRDAARAWFLDSYDSPDVCQTLVEVDGVTAAGALAIVMTGAPAPGRAAGRRAHVSNVSTLPAHRRRGYARLALDELIRWIHDESGADGAELFATDEGLALYESLGFAIHPYPNLRLSLTARAG